MHPLLNELVMASLMSFIPIPELTKLRLVCSAWNRSSLRRLKKADLKITFEGQSCSEVEKFNNTWKSKSSIPMPFSRFTFEAVTSICPAIEEFFHCFGSSLKHLVFSFSPQDTTGYTILSKILFEQTPQQNRKIIVANTLILNLFVEMFEDQVKIAFRPFIPRGELTLGVNQILKVLKELMLPNAKKFQISVTRVSQCRTDIQKSLCASVESFMRDILLETKSIENLNLEEFEIRMQVHFWSNSWMSLNAFDLALKEFLIHQKDNLKKLMIFADVKLPFFSDFRKYKFSNLETLEIVDYEKEELLKVYNILKGSPTHGNRRCNIIA